MSGYAYTYGQWPPPQPQPQPPQQTQQYAQFDYQPVGSTPPIYSNNPYQATPHYPAQIPPPSAPAQLHSHAPPHISHTPDFYAQSQTAYAYNTNKTSALGISGIPHGQSRGEGPPGGAGWMQGSTFDATSSSFPPQFPAKNQEIPASGSFQELFQPHRAPMQHEQSYPITTAPPLQIVSAPSPLAPSKDTHNIHVEEGELEEGELSEGTDMYDPQTVTSSAVLREDSISNTAQQNDEAEEDLKRPSLEPAVAIYAGVTGQPPSRDASVIDPQEDAFYDEDEDEERGGAVVIGHGPTGSDAADADDEYMGFSDSDQRSPVQEQHRAQSYSPHLSPQETRSGRPAPLQDGEGTKINPLKTLDEKTMETVRLGALGSEADGLAKEDSQKLVAEHASPVNTAPFASIDDAKKEAQKAILRLIPYGVNYQTFIDEGFDEKTIKSLFAELGLKSAQMPEAETSQPSPKPASVAESQRSNSDTNGPKLEERKDRIARLLALRASKPSAGTPPAVSTSNEAAAPPVEKAKLEKTRSDKARLLQQKLDALKRAQAASHAQSSGGPPQIPTLSELPPNGSVLVTPSSSALPQRPGPKTQASPAVRQQSVVLPASTIPSVVASGSGTPQAAGGSRKRPVAADLNDFSTLPSNPLKRPFGQMRQDSSLIIDVSDDSDSSSDVEMEMDSPTDEHPSKALQGGRARAGNSVRDFPPLSETPFQPRPFGRLPTSMRTPPSGPAATRAKDDEYARKMRQIEEMKRKIAEAEAKKARGSPSGSQTPRTGDSTPPEVDASAAKTPIRRAVSSSGIPQSAAPGLVEAVSARLPKPSDNTFVAADAARRALRTRIASQQLPRVEATLKEKMFKLKLLQDKVAALQKEIDVGMAEKMRLAETMVELDKEEVPAVSDQPQPTAVDAEAIRVTESPTADVQLQLLVEESAAAAVESMLVAADELTETTAVKDRAEPEGENRAKTEKPDAGEEESAAEDPLQSDTALEQDNMSEGPSYEPMADEADEVDEDGDIEMEDDVDEAATEPTVEAAPLEVLALPISQPLDENPVGDLLQPQQRQKSKQLPDIGSSKAPPPAIPALEPYESPLKCFRSYRFHPQYKSDVKGGLKSLTYSGRIDPDVELCPYELSGQACAAAPDCQYQHLSSIVPKDDQILVELGRSDDFTGEQKAKFVTGLRDVLKRFRDAKVRDFDTIAYEIIGFRRQFLGDDSKVVSHLEDVTV
ncbi:hypothetical protein CMQ_4960 [Grosmannia clavigera kw1407]|uniref:C3H1-type domain-containing protein n=1 Tax=Grosmannia clavigera (strain kw1407 / UAMH 11150) TaxID=655863 RepID=F0XK36_GROCL|nr:uncharacterized protein CMQ_4960 [Grosmannia clavigera kw1407]EFX01889.1 hypothetical protein CMQ_4960 [Grosmannia clavigera kw1407]